MSSDEEDIKKGVRVGSTLALFVFIFTLIWGSFYVVQPGERGFVVTLGHVPTEATTEGIGFKVPYISTIVKTSIKQQTIQQKYETFSSDLQQIDVQLAVLYRIPEKSVINLFKAYEGDVFDSLVFPRVQEAIKEVTATLTADGIVKKREEVKRLTLEKARLKMDGLVEIVDVVVADVALSKELEKAIEQKMVQEQSAAKAKFFKMQAEVEAQTAVVKAEGEAKAMAARAKGEAEAIELTGKALKDNPTVLDLQTIQKWNGIAPLVVGNGGNLLLPLEKGGK